MYCVRIQIQIMIKKQAFRVQLPRLVIIFIICTSRKLCQLPYFWL